MSKFFGRRPAIFRPAEFQPVTFMLRWAGGISLFFLVAQLAGLRAFTCILNGTVESVALGWQISQILGLAYIFIYLAFVVLVPVLVLAAMLLALWQKCRRK
ncbi:MAG: hypothetical protein P4N60_01930 [Verrucomicrobiae bacterium]|nr:hypothetical protein [Verrucomicrobiae bacterium]